MNQKRRLENEDSAPSSYQDPDYPPLKKGLWEKRCEEEAKPKVYAAVHRVLSKEFYISCSEKEKELEEIDSQILKVQKCLHLLRYASVSQYYSTSSSSSVSEQLSIHPAVRRILGGKAPIKLGEQSSSREEEEEKKPKLPSPLPILDIPSTLPGYIPPKDDSPAINFEPRGSSYKTKRRIIVGNVSKWIACDEREDSATHKWMIYVRGSKEFPDLSDVVDKVNCLLHPSYAPHDFLELSKTPFHLTRRGWGEFPARIQIVFKNPLDKPVDVIHHLKLDRTYTGLQTLGSETLLDVWLHTPFSSQMESQQQPQQQQIQLQKHLVVNDSNEEPVRHSEEDKGGSVVSHSTDSTLRSSSITEEKTCIRNCTSSLDNDVKVCYSSKKKDSVSKLKRPSYGPSHGLLNNGLQGLKSFSPSFPGGLLMAPGSSLLVKSNRSSLRTGMSLLLKKSPSLLSKYKSEVRIPGSTLSEVERAIPEIKVETWKNILGRSRDETQIEVENRIAKKGIHHLKKQTEYLKFLSHRILQINIKDFSSESDLILYISKALPLVISTAEDPLYRALHPYSSSSLNDYKSWNLGKQLASEWCRAKTIHRIMCYLKKVPDHSTSFIWKLLRNSGYSLSLERICYASTPEDSRPSVLNSCTPLELDFETFLPESKFKSNEEILVVVSDDDYESNVESKVSRTESFSSSKGTSFSAPKVSSLFPSDDADVFRYIHNTVFQLIGKNLETEELVKNKIKYPVATKVMAQALKSLVERILRSSFQESRRRKDIQIELIDVFKALQKSSSLYLFTNKGLGVEIQKKTKK